MFGSRTNSTQENRSFSHQRKIKLNDSCFDNLSLIMLSFSTSSLAGFVVLKERNQNKVPDEFSNFIGFEVFEAYKLSCTLSFGLLGLSYCNTLAKKFVER